MINRIRAKNFKTLVDIDLSLRPLNVLVGPNMAGKSNIIDLFRFITTMVRVAPGVSSGLVNAFNLRNGFFEVAWKGKVLPPISISIDAQSVLDDMPASWSYDLSILANPQGYIQIQDERLLLKLDEATHSLIDQENGQRLLRNRDSRMVSQASSADRSALEFEIPGWDGNAFRKAIDSWHFYTLIPALMRQANPTVAANFLSEHGDNLSSWLLNIQTRHQDVFARIREVAKDTFPSLDDLFTNPTQQATVFISTREKYLKRPASVWQMSDGELVFIAFLSLILAPDEFGSDLYCVEEPENHLHPRLIETLFHLLKQVRLSREAEQASQVILSTHSPLLVDLCDLDDLIVVERRQGATECTRPSAKGHLKALLEREEAGLGTLFYSGALSGAE